MAKNENTEAKKFIIPRGPTAKEVKPLDGYRLLVTFDNEEIRIYDAAPLIRGDWFGQLKDVNMFNSVHIAGISVEWAGGQDVCPDDLYYNSTAVDTEDLLDSIKKA